MELQGTPHGTSRSFNFDGYTFIARLTPLSEYINNDHPGYMEEYRFNLTILDSLNREIQNTSVPPALFTRLHVYTAGGVTSYIMTPDNREPLLRHLTELYHILCEVADVAHHDSLEDLLDEINPVLLRSTGIFKVRPNSVMIKANICGIISLSITQSVSFNLAIAG